MRKKKTGGMEESGMRNRDGDFIERKTKGKVQCIYLVLIKKGYIHLFYTYWKVKYLAR